MAEGSKQYPQAEGTRPRAGCDRAPCCCQVRVQRHEDTLQPTHPLGQRRRRPSSIPDEGTQLHQFALQADVLLGLCCEPLLSSCRECLHRDGAARPPCHSDLNTLEHPSQCMGLLADESVPLRVKGVVGDVSTEAKGAGASQEQPLPARISSRWLSHRVRLHNYQTQLRRLPLDLPYHPLSVCRLIYRQPLRHIGCPVLQQRVDNPR
jgi:hypothetical protein